MELFFRICIFTLCLFLTACVTTTEGPFTAKKDEVRAASQYVQLGLAYFQQGDYDVAIQKLEKALEIQPDQHEADAALGLVYQALNEADVAEDYFKEALRANPDYTRGRTYYAAFLYQQNRLEESVQQFERAASDVSYPSRASIFSNIGLVNVRLDRTEAAIEAYRRSLSLRRDQPQVVLALATLYYRLDDITKATTFYQDFKSSVRSRKASHTPQSLRLGIDIARNQQDLNEEASLILLLRSLYPNSKEYQEIKEAS